MSDPIERQAALDALDEQIRQCDKALSAFDISTKDEYAVKVERASLVAFRETLEYMPSARPGWIPVTERLPKPNEYENDVRVYYLVQNEYGDMMVCSWHGGYWLQMYRNTHVEDKVVAWMPLPKPAKIEG